MKEKIEWYREVLELEPGSKIFFPLARLLAANLQPTEAIETLRQGVVRHPDHIEARLLLVELLFNHAGVEQATGEVAKLGSLFAAYPGFWKAWSSILAQNPAMQDASLALRFFSAAIQGKAVSWAGVIEQGLSALLAGQPQALPLPCTPEQEPNLPPLSPATEEDQMPSLLYRVEAPPFLQATGGEEEETEEFFSLRTRSMADVLAEQGDIAGAIDIYKELLEHAAEADKEDLETRLATLTSNLATPVPNSPAPDEDDETAFKGRTRMADLLASLADRLEARAG